MKIMRIIASVSAVGLAVGTAMVVPPITMAEDANAPAEAQSSVEAAPEEHSESVPQQPDLQPVMDGIHLSVEDGKILLNRENIGQGPSVFFPDDAKPGATFTATLPKDKNGKVFVPTELVDIDSSMTVESLDHSRHVGDLTLLDKDSSQSVTEGDEIQFTLQDDSNKIERWIGGVLPAVYLEEVPTVEAEVPVTEAPSEQVVTTEESLPHVSAQAPAAETPIIRDVANPLAMAEEKADAAVEREGSTSLEELLKRNGGELNIAAKKCNPDGTKVALNNGVMGAKDAATNAPEPLVELSITGKRACTPEETSTETTSSSEESTSQTTAPAAEQNSESAEQKDPTETTSAVSSTASVTSSEVAASQASITYQPENAEVNSASSVSTTSSSTSKASSTVASTTVKSTTKTTKTSTKAASTSANPRPAQSTRVVITAIPSGPTGAAGPVPVYVK